MILVVCLLIIAGIFAGELRIKNRIERMELPPGGEKKLFGGRILICRHHNSGMCFNLAEGRYTVIAVTSIVVTILITCVFIMTAGQVGSRLLRIGLSVFLGGAFSNTYDRLKRKYVVDYFSFGVRWKGLRRWIFNLSDFCIVIGALLTVLGAAR